MPPGFDRCGQDVGNIVLLEHINLEAPDQRLVTDFYISALGMTRDPCYMVHTDNFWANLGGQQMHLPTGQPMLFRGEIILVTDILKIVRKQMALAHIQLSGTQFFWQDEGDAILATGPWGNRFRLVESWPGFDQARGIAGALIEVPMGAAKPISRFYCEIMGALVELEEGEPAQAKVRVGPGQHLIYQETSSDIPPYDGHHLCIYTPKITRIYEWLHERGLITLEDNQYQFRFQAILNPENGQTVYELEHEVRSLHHPMFKRQLVNRRGDEALP